MILELLNVLSAIAVIFVTGMIAGAKLILKVREK